MSHHPKRDVTIALNTVNAAQWMTEDGKVYYRLTVLQGDRLLRILTDIDARTGKKDPHLRRKAARKR